MLIVALACSKYSRDTTLSTDVLTSATFPAPKGSTAVSGTRLQMLIRAEGHQTEYDIQTGGGCNQPGIAGHSREDPSGSGLARSPHLSPPTDEECPCRSSSAASVETNAVIRQTTAVMAEGLSEVGENENEVDTTTNVRILS